MKLCPAPKSKRETCRYATAVHPHPIFPDQPHYANSLCVFPAPAWILRDLRGTNRVHDTACENCLCWTPKVGIEATQTAPQPLQAGGAA